MKVRIDVQQETVKDNKYMDMKTTITHAGHPE
jgi:hypothetical protein